MELVVKKPTYANGVYSVLQIIKRKAYVGESNDIYRRISEHICGISGIEIAGYGSNKNLAYETDKRFEIRAIYNNPYTYVKRGNKGQSSIYDETIFMFLMRKYGFDLYNSEKDNVGKKGIFLVEDTLTSPELDSEKFKTEISSLKQKTINFLLTLKINESLVTEKRIIEDIKKHDSKLKDIFKDIFGADFEEGIWHYSDHELIDIWNRRVCKIEEDSEKCGRDSLSVQYYLIKCSDKTKEIYKEISDGALRKDAVESCGIETISKYRLAESIRSKKFDTTIFTSFGGYFGQLPSTILATKSSDIEENGFCLWALKKLNEKDTRKFLETSNENGHEDKYIFLTYTPSKKLAGDMNTPRLNLTEGEHFDDFKTRMKNSIANSTEDVIAKKILINIAKKEKNKMKISEDILSAALENMFPMIINSGDNKALLISNLYVLDGYVKNFNKMYDYYWAHFANLSDNGFEKSEIKYCYCSTIEKDEYDKVEEIIDKNGKNGYRTYKEHKEIQSWRPHICARIRGDKEREEFAKMILEAILYDESEENKDYRNVIIAKLKYPYIVTLTE